MTVFESSVIINRPVSDVYNFLADFNNHRQLMPDNIEDWASDPDGASFSIPNMTKLSLRIDERVKDTSIRIIPAEKAPFELELSWAFTSENDQTTVLYHYISRIEYDDENAGIGPAAKIGRPRNREPDFFIRLVRSENYNELFKSHITL